MPERHESYDVNGLTPAFSEIHIGMFDAHVVMPSVEATQVLAKKAACHEGRGHSTYMGGNPGSLARVPAKCDPALTVFQ